VTAQAIALAVLLVVGSALCVLLALDTASDTIGRHRPTSLGAVPAAVIIARLSAERRALPRSHRRPIELPGAVVRALELSTLRTRLVGKGVVLP